LKLDVVAFRGRLLIRDDCERARSAGISPGLLGRLHSPITSQLFPALTQVRLPHVLLFAELHDDWLVQWLSRIRLDTGKSAMLFSGSNLSAVQPPNCAPHVEPGGPEELPGAARRTPTRERLTPQSSPRCSLVAFAILTRLFPLALIKPTERPERSLGGLPTSPTSCTLMEREAASGGLLNSLTLCFTRRTRPSSWPGRSSL
jgi:hypothetical protein